MTCDTLPVERRRVRSGLADDRKLLRHTQVQKTARYAHLAADPVEDAADRVASTALRSSLRSEPFRGDQV